MPLLFDPRATVPVTLRSDETGPEDKRPAFLCRAVSSADDLTIADLLRRARESEDAEAVGLLGEALSIGITGWRNMPGGFPEYSDEARGRLRTLLTSGELWELALRMVAEVKLKESELKKSASPSAPGSAPSAAVPTAGPAAPAPTT